MMVLARRGRESRDHGDYINEVRRDAREQSRGLSLREALRLHQGATRDLGSSGRTHARTDGRPCAARTSGAPHVRAPTGAQGLHLQFVIGSLPVALVYSFFVEYYVSGLTGSVKE